jgi:hypothetical protein
VKWHPDRQAARGAATVEFFVSTLLLVPVILYAIWVGEVYAVGAKAQEAEIAAMWDASAYRVHDFNRGTRARSRLDAIATATELSIGGALEDLDSTRDATGNKRPFVGGHGTLELRCRTITAAQLQRENAGTLVSFRSLRTDTRKAVDATTSEFLQQEGTVSCFATASYVADFFPSWVSRFGRNEVFRDGDRDGFNMFGVGGSDRGDRIRQGGPVRSGAYLLLDEWAVEDGNEAGAQVSSSAARSRNPKFFRVAKAVGVLDGETVTGEQVREVTDTLYGLPFDPADSEAFKLGLHLDLNERRRFNPDQGEQRPPLLPRDDGEAGLPDLERVAAERTRDHYLGHRNANFLGP